MEKANKILAIILAILMVVSITPITASAAITGTAGKDITWELDKSTGILTFSGSGEMYFYTSSHTPWDTYKNYIKEVVINEGITTIGEYAFYKLYITDVTLPNSLIRIEDFAFSYCTKLTTVTIPDGVIQIDSYAFSNCTGLTSVTMYKGVGFIGDNAFAKCTSLTDVNYLGTLEDWYGIGIAEGNGNLYVVDITSLPSKNFTWEFDEETATLTITGSGEIVDFRYEDDWGGYYCGTRPWEDILENDVKHVVINEGITYIGAYAFAYSDSLETVTMSSVETISTDAFNSCVNLKSVTTSNSLKVIGDDAFYKCDKLTYIYYSGTQNEWDHVKIGDHWNDEMDTVKVYPSDYVVYSAYGTYQSVFGGNIFSWVFDAYSSTLTISGEGDLNWVFSLPWEENKYDIKRLVFSDGITGICSIVFKVHPNLEEIVIPASVTEIAEQAFQSEFLTDVYYTGTEEQWKSVIIGEDNDALLNATIHYNYVECEHNFETTVVTEPTCINRGYTTHICSICNESYVDSFLEFTECLDYVEVIWPPTCTEQGYIAYECPVCHTGYLEKYLDPTHNYEQTSVTQPTCTTQGYTTYTCTACGKTVNDDYTSSFGHDYGDVIETIAPTCTEKGYTKQICTRCEFEFVSNKVPALGHSYIEVSTKAPTCTEQGYTTYECSVCGDGSLDDYVDATGHTVDSFEVTKEPTCTIEGKRTGICSVCSEEVTEITSHLGHDYGELTVEYEATCTTDGRMSKKCSRCESKIGTVILPAIGHTYDEWEQVDDAKCGEYGRFERFCLTCGQLNVMSAPADHNYSKENILVEATCTTAGSKTLECSDCGKTTTETIPATGHNYESKITTPAGHTATGVMTYTCACGDTYTETIDKIAEHNHDAIVTAPTCTEQGHTTYTCECGDSYIADYVDATGHNYDTTVTTPTCTEQGYTTYTCECGDSYIDDYVDATGHNYDTTVTAPTCTEQGYTTYTCECGDSYVDDYVDATGHTPAEPIQKWPANPTCIEKGSIYEFVYCSECGEEISSELVVIEATGHKDTDNDGYCDNCEEQLCNHRCHKSGFAGFIWKVFRLVDKIFGINKVCDCGVLHY